MRISGSWDSEDTMPRSDGSNILRRFKLKPGESAAITVIQSDDPIAVLEHKVYTSESNFGLTFVSPKTFDQSARDPLIEKGFYPKKVRLLTVIRDELVTQKGTQKNVKMILAIPPKTAEWFRNFIANEQETMEDPSKFTLKGCRFKVKRSDDQKSLAVGDTWLPAGRLSDKAMSDRGYDLEPVPEENMYSILSAVELENVASKAIKYEEKFFGKSSAEENTKQNIITKKQAVKAEDLTDSEIPF